jgi:hypothetical protein
MRLPWRKHKHTNPWDDDPLELSAWAPAQVTNYNMVLGMLTSLCRAQWMLGEYQLKMWRRFSIAGFVWLSLALLNLYWMSRAMGWW